MHIPSGASICAASLIRFCSSFLSRRRCHTEPWTMAIQEELGGQQKFDPDWSDLSYLTCTFDIVILFSRDTVWRPHWLGNRRLSTVRFSGDVLLAYHFKSHYFYLIIQSPVYAGMQCAGPYVLENWLCLTAHQLLPNESTLESMLELVGYTVRFRKLWYKVSFAQFQRVFVSSTRAWWRCLVWSRLVEHGCWYALATVRTPQNDARQLIHLRSLHTTDQARWVVNW